MSEYIRKKDAVQELAEYLMEDAEVEYAGMASDDIKDWIELAEDILEDASTIEPKQGEWIDIHKSFKYLRACSECGWQHDVVHYGDSFCPHCGARMKGADDE